MKTLMDAPSESSQSKSMLKSMKSRRGNKAQMDQVNYMIQGLQTTIGEHTKKIEDIQESIYNIFVPDIKQFKVF